MCLCVCVCVCESGSFCVIQKVETGKLHVSYFTLVHDDHCRNVIHALVCRCNGHPGGVASLI